LQFTARFTRDESSDLVAIKNIFTQKKITLIGPISEGGIEVFSSLTYYLLLPFCILLNFDPLAPVLGTAFYGFFTVVTMSLIIKKNHWSSLFLFLVIIFTPLLESSRTAWNPLLIPFWQSLALLVLLSNLPLKYIFTGILMGLTIHQHWYAVFTVLSIIPIIFILNKKIKFVLQYSLGFFFSIFPFILFDLTHPPGLFFTRMLYFSPLSSDSSKVNIFYNLWQNTIGVFHYFSGNQLILGIISSFLTLIIVIRHHSKNNLWLLPLLFQIVCLSLTHSQYADRYLLPAAIFYLFWLLQSQKYILAKLLTFLLIISNLFNLSTILNFTDWSRNIQAQKQIINYISENQQHSSLYNLIVLQSPDGNTKGVRFKDLLKLKNVSPKDESNYQNINTLYTITYQNDWSKLSQDHAYELNNFRSQKPTSIIKIPNSNWLVYKLSQNKD
jgi:hypothetical protein